MVDDKLVSDFSYPASPGDYFPPILGDPGEEEAPSEARITTGDGFQLVRPRYASTQLYIAGGVAMGFQALSTVTYGGTGVDVLIAWPLLASGYVHKMAVNVDTAAPANSKVRLGIYESISSKNIHPGRLLHDAGELDISTTGTKEITVGGLALRADRIYWYAYVRNSAAISGVMRAAPNDIFLGYTVLTAGAGSPNTIRAPFTFGALPITFPLGVTIGTFHGNTCPLFMLLREFA